MKFLRKYGKIGIVDEDPFSTQPKDMVKYKIVEISENINLFQRNDDKSKHLIVISKNIEDWILKRAKTNKISLKHHNLPSNPETLHNIPHIEKRIELQAFLRNLIGIDEEINLLKKWLSEYH
ncbi:MAG: hypothetical protein ACTSP4_07720 [Candidatus Hodarchaeales archaeon]